MAYPNLRFMLNHDGRASFQSGGSGKLSDVLVSVYGAKNAAQMIAVGPSESGDTGISVEGFVSLPSLHRSNRSEITLFVNGRWVQDQSLTFAVTQAYHTLLMSKRYPIAVLRVQLPPEDVDVNVHPAKTQVRFRDGDAVFRTVQRTVRRALLDQASVRDIEGSVGPDEVDSSDVSDGSWPGGWPTPEQFARRIQLRSLRSAQSSRPQERPPETQFAFEMPRSASARPSSLAVSGLSPQSDQVPAEEGSGGSQPTNTRVGPERTGLLPFLRVVGQLGLMYIVAEGPDGMFLIDQHAAHERVLYERFMAEKTNERIPAQALLEPVTIELTMEGFDLVEENLEALLGLGFDLEPFGGNTVLVRQVPAILVGDDVQALVEEMVSDLQGGDEPLAEEMEARLIRRVCKQAAIKAGQTLSRQEMDELIRQLESCASPHTCPHGRPTMIHMSATTLAHEFGRLG
jgi:DNA mismatch repair protein MutL